MGLKLYSLQQLLPMFNLTVQGTKDFVYVSFGLNTVDRLGLAQASHKKQQFHDSALWSVMSVLLQRLCIHTLFVYKIMQ
jgi:hypothetical protein